MKALSPSSQTCFIGSSCTKDEHASYHMSRFFFISVYVYVCACVHAWVYICVLFAYKSLRKSEEHQTSCYCSYIWLCVSHYHVGVNWNQGLYQSTKYSCLLSLLFSLHVYVMFVLSYDTYNFFLLSLAKAIGLIQLHSIVAFSLSNESYASTILRTLQQLPPSYFVTFPHLPQSLGKFIKNHSLLVPMCIFSYAMSFT